MIIYCIFIMTYKSDNITMINIRLLIFFLLIVGFSSAQPPPVCFGNNNTGAGGVIGNSRFASGYAGEDIYLGFVHNADDNPEFNDVFILYIATSAPGRNILDQTVNDADDPYRIAITNSNVNGFIAC